MGIIKVHNEVPCEFRLISKQDVSCKLCVYNAFCKTQWSGGVRGLHSLDVVHVN
jgi:hypothetical protein